MKQGAPLRNVAVAIKTKDAISGAARAPSAPLNEDELILAIQKELTRLKLYSGPLTPRWTRKVRAAARKFTGTRRTKPSNSLLAALRAAKPENKPDNKRSVARDVPSLHLQSAEGWGYNGSKPVTAFSFSEARGVLSDGYLPPWQSMRGKEPPVTHGTRAKLATRSYATAHRRKGTLADAGF